MKICKILCLSLVLGFAAPASANHPPVTTVPSVDLDRYMGLWYEIASIPQKFQKACVSNITAEYAILENGEVEVYNSCEKNNGERKDATGRAKVVDQQTNAKLKVTFVKVFDWIYLLGGDYWVIDLADDYRYAVVGHPSRKYAWILSRTPSMATEDLQLVYQNLITQKYDTCKILTSIQNGGFFERRQLCEVVQP